MRNISMIPILSVLLLLSSETGLAQTPVPEESFEGANGLHIHVKEVAPGNQPSSVQVICYINHKRPEIRRSPLSATSIANWAE